MNEREISMCLKLSIFMQGKADHYTANLVIGCISDLSL